MAEESEVNRKSEQITQKTNDILEEGEIFQFYDAGNDVALLVTTTHDGKLKFEYRGHLWVSVEMNKPVVNRLIRILEEWRK